MIEQYEMQKPEFTLHNKLQLQAVCDAYLVIYELMREDYNLRYRITPEQKSKLIAAAKILNNYKYDI